MRFSIAIFARTFLRLWSSIAIFARTFRSSRELFCDCDLRFQSSCNLAICSARDFRLRSSRELLFGRAVSFGLSFSFTFGRCILEFLSDDAGTDAALSDAVSFGVCLGCLFRYVYALSDCLRFLFRITLSLSDCLRAFVLFRLSLSDFPSFLMRLLTLDAALSDAVYFGCCYRWFFARRLFRPLFLSDADALLQTLLLFFGCGCFLWTQLFPRTQIITGECWQTLHVYHDTYLAI